MSEEEQVNEPSEVVEQEAQPSVDYLKEIKNLKAEMSRKLENQNNTIQQQQQEMIRLLSAVNSPAKSAVETQEDLSNLLYSDPGKAMDMVRTQTKAEIMQEIEAQNRSVARQNQILNELAMEYPELANIEHDLPKTTLDIFNSLDAESQRNPMSYEVAVHKAAAKLGILAKSRRNVSNTNSNSEFSFGNSSKRPSSNKSKVPDNTLALARLLGAPVDDPKFMARLSKNYSKGE